MLAFKKRVALATEAIMQSVPLAELDDDLTAKRKVKLQEAGAETETLGDY